MVFQELEEEKVITSKPWMGGMPYKILDISPPLILASAVNNELGKTPPLFFDASAVTFIKVPDKFKRLWAQEYAAYYKATKKKIVPTVDKSGVELTTYKPLSFEDQLQSLMDQVTEKKEDDKP